MTRKILVGGGLLLALGLASLAGRSLSGFAVGVTARKAVDQTESLTVDLLGAEAKLDERRVDPRIALRVCTLRPHPTNFVATIVGARPYEGSPASASDSAPRRVPAAKLGLKTDDATRHFALPHPDPDNSHARRCFFVTLSDLIAHRERERLGYRIDLRAGAEQGVTPAGLQNTHRATLSVDMWWPKGTAGQIVTSYSDGADVHMDFAFPYRGHLDAFLPKDPYRVTHNDYMRQAQYELAQGHARRLQNKIQAQQSRLENPIVVPSGHIRAINISLGALQMSREPDAVGFELARYAIPAGQSSLDRETLIKTAPESVLRRQFPTNRQRDIQLFADDGDGGGMWALHAWPMIGGEPVSAAFSYDYDIEFVVEKTLECPENYCGGGRCDVVDGRFECTCNVGQWQSGAEGPRCQFPSKAQGIGCAHGGKLSYKHGRLACECGLWASGPLCERLACQPSTCKNQGTCVKCPTGGACRDGGRKSYCECGDGFSGENCEIEGHRALVKLRKTVYPERPFRNRKVCVLDKPAWLAADRWQLTQYELATNLPRPPKRREAVFFGGLQDLRPTAVEFEPGKTRQVLQAPTTDLPAQQLFADKHAVQLPPDLDCSDVNITLQIVRSPNHIDDTAWQQQRQMAANQQAASACFDNPCSRGTCVSASSGYRCECPKGRYGPNCELEQCPCRNSGVCNGNIGFMCECPAGAVGELCEQISLNPWRQVRVPTKRGQVSYQRICRAVPIAGASANPGEGNVGEMSTPACYIQKRDACMLPAGLLMPIEKWSAQRVYYHAKEASETEAVFFVGPGHDKMTAEEMIEKKGHSLRALEPPIEPVAVILGAPDRAGYTLDLMSMALPQISGGAVRIQLDGDARGPYFGAAVELPAFEGSNPNVAKVVRDFGFRAKENGHGCDDNEMLISVLAPEDMLRRSPEGVEAQWREVQRRIDAYTAQHHQ